MKRFVPPLAVAAVIIAAAACAAAIALPGIAVSAFASANKLDIGYDRLKEPGPFGMSFAGLAITDRSKGIGIRADDARLKFGWTGPDPRRISVGFDLRGVKLLKLAHKPAPSYDTLDGLVAMPFSAGAAYDSITGNVRFRAGDITITGFMAKSPDIRLSFNGTIKRDDTIDSDIVIYFSDNLTGRIPPELTKLVLTQESPGWKSLSVKLRGNYSMPTIHLSSKLFRLHIGVKEGS